MLQNNHTSTSCKYVGIQKLSMNSKLKTYIPDHGKYNVHLLTKDIQVGPA